MILTFNVSFAPGPPRTRAHGLESVTYPNNRVVQYNYNDGPQAAIDEVMLRLGSISNAGNTDTYAVESYLGLDNIVTEDYKDPQVKCDLSGGNYSGLDQFGRRQDMTWWQYDNSGNLTNNLDEDVYWRLNLDGNVTDQIELAANMSQVENGFGYDAMGRLASYSQQIDWGTAATSSYSYNSVGNNIDSTTGGQYDLANEETTIIGSSVSRRLRRGRQHANPQHGRRGDLRRLGPAGRGL